MPLIFVYGSLKEGFPNFHVNKGRRLQGDYKTAEAYPFFLLNGQLPCMLPSAGSGQQVVGQVFEVTPTALEAMDALERVGQPGGYRRIEIAVVPVDAIGAARVDAFVYVRDPEVLGEPGPHLGPFAEYTLEHAKSLRW